jgi:1-deoxy-D-xylulose 5-phosphate reductoisomerase
MMTPAEVERCLDAGREALVLLAELVVKGQRTRGEICERVQAEHDALVSLLDEAPETSTPRSTACCCATRG